MSAPRRSSGSTSRTLPSAFGALLRQSRLARGHTQADAGDELGGVRQQTIGAWERGERPHVSAIPKLASYVGCSEDEVVQLLDSDSKITALPDLNFVDAANELVRFGTDVEAMRFLAAGFGRALQEDRVDDEDRAIVGRFQRYFESRLKAD